jgi:hypothetical protein
VDNNALNSSITNKFFCYLKTSSTFEYSSKFFSFCRINEIFTRIFFISTYMANFVLLGSNVDRSSAVKSVYIDVQGSSKLKHIIGHVVLLFVHIHSGKIAIMQ